MHEATRPLTARHDHARLASRVRSYARSLVSPKCLLVARSLRFFLLFLSPPACLAQAAFVADEVVNIIKETADSILGPHNYHHTRVAGWCSKLCEEVLKRLADQHKPFKYIVTALIMQRTGAGLHCASSCYWDNLTDASCSYKWSGRSMYCIVTVFGLAI